jgi:hypothetical protein
MRINRNLVGVLAVGALAFVAGRSGLFTGGAIAVADPIQDATHDGKWEGAWRMRSGPDIPWMEATGSIKRSMIFDGRYLEENVEATSEMGTFRGRGYMAYDNVDGQYEMVWLDNMSTGLYFESGTYDAETMQFTMYGEQRDPATGHIVRSYGTLDVSNPDRHQYVGYSVNPDGKRFKSFTATMERIGN